MQIMWCLRSTACGALPAAYDLLSRLADGMPAKHRRDQAGHMLPAAYSLLCHVCCRFIC